MLALVFFALSPRIKYHDDKNNEGQSDENNHAGLGFPNLLNATRKLGPIHVSKGYTIRLSKQTLNFAGAAFADGQKNAAPLGAAVIATLNHMQTITQD